MNIRETYINYGWIKHFLGEVLILFMVFTYIYAIQFNALRISCNIIYGFLGIVWFFLKKLGAPSNETFRFERSTIGICMAAFSVIAVTMLSEFINLSSDMSFIWLLILTLISFCGAYFIAEVMKIKDDTITFENIVFYLTLAALLQMVLTIMLFTVPGFSIIAQTLLRFADLTTEVMESHAGLRLMGFGTSFFNSGYIHGLVLIAIGAVVRQNQISSGRQLFYLLAFLFISIISIIASRTTLVGFGLGGLLMLKTIFKHSKKNLLIVLATAAAIVGVIIANLSEETLALFGRLLNYGFELFINYFTKHEIRTNSTDIMMNMYVFPDNLKTWLIGDGYFTDPTLPGSYYYMGTDIGYCRLLFLFGIVGTLTFCLYEMYILYQIYLNSGTTKAFVVMVGILFLVVNLKGFADLAQYAILFTFVTKHNNLLIQHQYDKNQ